MNHTITNFCFISNWNSALSKWKQKYLTKDSQHLFCTNKQIDAVVLYDAIGITGLLFLGASVNCDGQVCIRLILRVDCFSWW